MTSWRQPKRGGNLLQEDDHRDTSGEAFDDGPRNGANNGAETQEPCRHDQEASHEGHESESPVAVSSHHGRKHHHHCPGGAGNLDVGAAHDGGDHARNDRGDDPGLSANAGRDPKGEGERKRDDANRETGHDVEAPRGANLRVVGA